MCQELEEYRERVLSMRQDQVKDFVHELKKKIKDRK